MSEVTVFIEIREALLSVPEKDRNDFVSVEGFKVLKKEVQEAVIKKLQEVNNPVINFQSKKKESSKKKIQNLRHNHR